MVLDFSGIFGDFFEFFGGLGRIFERITGLYETSFTPYDCLHLFTFFSTHICHAIVPGLLGDRRS